MSTTIKTILLPTDFSNKSKNALKLAVKMAQRHNAKLIVTHMVHTYFLIDRGGKQVIGSQTIQENIDRANEKVRALAIELKEKYNFDVETKISNQSIVDGINELVVTDNIDLVIVGTSGRQKMKEFILGSNSYNVLLHANCSVLLVPQTFKRTTFKKILFPVRVQNELDQKATLSLLLAKKNKGGINILGVGDPDRMVSVRTSFLEMKRELAKSVDCISEFKLSHDNAQIISEVANSKESDIIMLADYDEDIWKSFLSDNFFKKMINNTDVPLFIVKSKLNKIKNNPEEMTGYDLTLPIPG
ncbi:universal stress protein [Chryseobacterium sp. SNU WT5]|uniref:universal stress protein n=1 Tax=Chryseobacterium sp. SNU WT5 TaxID=2594269 RepID=UPI0016291E30|nr:universal stress protein [Chryseobacterium sp. SNU WT5]